MAGGGELVGRETSKGVWVQGLALAVAEVVRLVDEEVSFSEGGLGAGLQCMVWSSVPRTDCCCDGGYDRSGVSARKSRGGERDG